MLTSLGEITPGCLSLIPFGRVMCVPSPLHERLELSVLGLRFNDSLNRYLAH